MGVGAKYVVYACYVLYGIRDRKATKSCRYINKLGKHLHGQTLT